MLNSSGWEGKEIGEGGKEGRRVVGKEERDKERGERRAGRANLFSPSNI